MNLQCGWSFLNGFDLVHVARLMIVLFFYCPGSACYIGLISLSYMDNLCGVVIQHVLFSILLEEGHLDRKLGIKSFQNHL